MMCKRIFQDIKERMAAHELIAPAPRRIPTPEIKRECARCHVTTSAIWWKCCPTHTPERSTAIVCFDCYNDLHPTLPLVEPKPW